MTVLCTTVTAPASRCCIDSTRHRDSTFRFNILTLELKRDEEQAFYKAKHVSEFKNERVSKALIYLRQNGICILDGEIELLFRQHVTGKLSLDKVYDLNRRIIEGETPSTFMETDVLRDFISKVIRD